MPPTTIHEPPAADSFTKLEEHQAQTPATFYNAKPVLHYMKSGIRAAAPRDQLSKLPVLGRGANGESQTPTPGSTEALDAAVSVQSVDVWINSEYDILDLLVCCWLC